MQKNASDAAAAQPWARTAESNTWAAAAGQLLLTAGRERPGPGCAWRVYEITAVPAAPAVAVRAATRLAAQRSAEHAARDAR
jgi:hypothetical protein